jgi:hypothetical protein
MHAEIILFGETQWNTKPQFHLLFCMGMKLGLSH